MKKTFVRIAIAGILLDPFLTFSSLEWKEFNVSRGSWFSSVENELPQKTNLIELTGDITYLVDIKKSSPEFSVPNVTGLKIRERFFLREDGAECLEQILSIFPSLTTLELPEVLGDDYTCKAIATAAPGLHRLVVDTAAKGVPAHIKDEGVKILCENLHSLNELHIGSQPSVTDVSAGYIADYLPQLEYLKLDSNGMSSKGLEILKQKYSHLLAQGKLDIS